MKKFVFFNCAIITAEGNYIYKKSSVEEINSLIDENGINSMDSAIGHQATADVLNTVLGMPLNTILVNRVKYAQQSGQTGIVFAMRDRIPEGTILTVNEIQQIGFDFYLLEKIK